MTLEREGVRYAGALHELAEPLAKPCAVENAKTGKIYRLDPATEANVSAERDISPIMHICNEPPIYNLLFVKRCMGHPYTTVDGERFLVWAARGWREGTHFVYLLRNDSGQVAGAIDIKSANRESAEIGYWLSIHHSGVMTNAVHAVVELARASGYTELYALVRRTNTRSVNVLTRAGFTESETMIRNETIYDRWVLVLA